MAKKDPSGSIFDHLGVPDPEAEKREQEEAKAAGKTTEVNFNERIAQLEGMIKGMQYSQQSQYEQPGRDYQDSEPAYEPAGWGDPIEDPKGFQANLAKYIDNVMVARESHREKQTAAQRQAEARSAQLWNTFQQKYPQYKDNPDRVKFIATQVVEQARERGMDVERYMTQAQDDFIKDVADKYQTVFGDSSQPESRASADADDAGRTSGIFGGLESGGKAAAGPDSKDGDMIDDLKNIQRAMGLF